MPGSWRTARIFVGGPQDRADTLAMRRLALVLVLVGAAGLAPRRAAADLLPDGMARSTESFSIVNAAEFPGFMLVQYPAICDSSTGRPHGVDADKDDLGLIDYQVLVAPADDNSATRCVDPQLYVVERGDWTVGTVMKTPAHNADDENAALLEVKELDAMSAAERARFFREDPRAHPTLYALARSRLVDAGEPLRNTRDMLRLHRAGDRFRLRCEQVVYTYADETEETLPCVDGRRTPPSGQGKPRPVPPTAMVSSVPRWPFIAAGGGVFLVMVLLGLRRRR